ncbi:J domain-containing protein [Haloechinothrix sp. LS1_15]|uniref:J domain-containing protein n=1 Tax=Haloechinothrix sp. LS1_15 TaxID=2652248 RepID=UPI002943F938|nr:J domain-containing protein [Haloechinothrix sp. LS1_15]MDV6011801.1 J domain-containing protein [Haloechinothrix sp. LS1_15]
MSRGGPGRDPYEVLGVTPQASQAEITTAYRTLVRQLHPDTQHNDPDRLREVVDAYDVLRDEQRRADHDRQHPSRSTAESGTRHPGHTPSQGVNVPVRVRRPPPERGPNIRAGPVRRHR